tara:strand:- start:120840 stop:121331 length:492 start_codon:yes stop_codon:yes gene_type:complete
MSDFSFEQILQLISTLAVVATLIYLAMQIRQSNLLQQSNILMESTNTFNNFAMAIAEDQKLSELYFSAIIDIKSLDIDKQRHAVLLITSMIRMFENVYLQNEANSFHSKAWEGYSQQSIQLMNNPGVLAFLENRRSWFAASFVEYILNNIPQIDESAFTHDKT